MTNADATFKVGDRIKVKDSECDTDLKNNHLSRNKVYEVLDVKSLYVNIMGDHGYEGSVLARRFELVKEETFTPGEPVEIVRMYSHPYKWEDAGESFGKQARYHSGPRESVDLDGNPVSPHFVTIGESSFVWRVEEIRKMSAPTPTQSTTTNASDNEVEMSLDSYKTKIAEYVNDRLLAGDICEDGYDEFMKFAGLEDKSVDRFEIVVTVRLDRDAVRNLGITNRGHVDLDMLHGAIAYGQINGADFEVENFEIDSGE